MTILVFLSELKSALDGELPNEEILKHLKYYREYMESRLESEGEEQITARLGDPRLIAKTLVETYRMANSDDTQYAGDESKSYTYREESRDGDRAGKGASFRRRGINLSDMQKIKISRWILIMSAILIIVLILVILFFVGKIAIKLFIPFLVVGLVITLVRKLRQH